MADDGIVESSPATVIKRTKVDWNIETPFVGSGDDLGTQTSRVSGVHRSKYVTPSGRVIKEYDDEVGDQEIYPYEGSATEKVIKQKKLEERKSLLTKVVDWLRRDNAELQAKVDAAQDAVNHLPGESIAKLGDSPDNMTDADYEKYLLKRQQQQNLAAYVYKRDKQ
jgi:hypothetical protein